MRCETKKRAGTVVAVEDVDVATGRGASKDAGDQDWNENGVAILYFGY